MRDRTIRREFRVLKKEIRFLRYYIRDKMRVLKRLLWWVIVAIVLVFGVLVYTRSQR